MLYGYVRVSTREQNEDRQMIAMREFGVEKIFMDKQSGKDFDRPEYKKLVRKLKAGDVLVVHSLDRFGRNYDKIIEQWKLIVKEKGADIVVLDMPLLDTRNDKNLTGRLIADIVLQLLAYVAQTEREAIRKRQREGIDAALARGVRFGREKIPIPPEFAALAEEYANSGAGCRPYAERLGVCQNTFLRWCRDAGIQIKRGQDRITPDKYQMEFIRAYRAGKIAAKIASELCGVSESTFYRWCKNEEGGGEDG